MVNNMWKNGFVVGVIFLFFISCITPNISGTSKNEANNLEKPYNIENFHSKIVDWWSMFHHDLGNTGYSTSLTPDKSTLSWISEIGCDCSVNSRPTIDDWKVFIGACNGYLYCINALDGNLIWNTKLVGIFVSSVAVANERVFVGCGDNVYCLDESNGNQIWNFSGGSIPEWNSPSVAYDKVYIGSSDHNIYCLNALNGSVEWIYETKARIRSSPAIADEKVYIGSNDHNLYCLNATNGNLIWNYSTGDDIECSPAIADGKVYIGSHDHNLYCLNATNGDLLWFYGTGERIYSTPAIAYDKIYFGSTDDNVYCLNASNGDLMWIYKTGDNVDGSPAVADGKVFVGSFDNNVYCLNAFNGKKIWNYKTDYHVNSPAISDEKVYCVESYWGKIYAFGPDYTPPILEFEEPEIGYFYPFGGFVKIGRYLITKTPWPFLYEKSAAIIHGGFVGITVKITEWGSGINESIVKGYFLENPNAYFSLEHIGGSLYQGTLDALCFFGRDWTLKVEAKDNANNQGSTSIKIFHYRNFVKDLPI
jgi:outer membrane protein assembly factor BamB